jgi:hypothetical protein
VRKAVAAVLFALTGALLLLAWAALDNLWADYQDTPDSTYIDVAAIELGLALVCAAGGVWALRCRSGSRFGSVATDVKLQRAYDVERGGQQAALVLQRSRGKLLERPRIVRWLLRDLSQRRFEHLRPYLGVVKHQRRWHFRRTLSPYLGHPLPLRIRIRTPGTPLPKTIIAKPASPGKHQATTALIRANGR